MPVKLKRMTAVFGSLNGAVLTPGDGLTVIAAPNESGKSTWAAFVRAMLYGIDTRDRDKAGYLADKNRYQPWSGAPMSGELELEWQGRDVTLRRASGRSGPFQQFEAVYTASGDPVPGLTGANAGQTILGVGRDVFTRSALVGQNAAAITAVPELESRIAALATAGQEDVSFSATQRTLRDWRNRRRANRANGLIAELERELAAAETSLGEMARARDERETAAARLAALREQRRELEFQQSLLERARRRDLNRRYAQAELALENARGELDRLPSPDPAYAGLTAAEARARGAARQAEEEQAQRERAARRSEREERGAALKRRRAGIKTALAATVPLLGAGGLALVIIGFVLARYVLSWAGFAAMLAAVAAAILFVNAMGRLDRRLSALSGEEEDLPEGEPLPDPEAYAAWLARRELLERELAHCRERLEDLAAQGGQPLDTLELLPDPSLTQSQVTADLAENGQETALWQSRLDRAEGALRTDPLELEARRERLEGEIARRTAEYDALTEAMEGLERANAALRERFSPALNREAAAIFSALTGGRWSALTLSRDLSALVSAGEGTQPRSALYLSAGTADQLYLAVRLALCRLTLPDAPILLDDALCAFDDERMALAMEALHDLAKDRQILLFTCHSREADWARAHGAAVIG